MKKRNYNADEEQEFELDSEQKLAQNSTMDSVPKMDFDTWFAINSHLIPSHHYKEIIRADFKARKLTAEETQEDFDKALRLYGVKL